jgi:hypothetical protein
MTARVVTADYLHYEVDGPPRFMVADIHGGNATLLFWDHPDDTLEGMRAEARRLRASRRLTSTRKNAKIR